jgi:hypothetical protein
VTQVDIVDPLQLEKNFDSILEKPTIAKNVRLHFLLSADMYVRSSDEADEMEVEGKQQANHVEKEVGNVNADSDISFEYGVKKDFAKRTVDTLPFQVQVSLLISNPPPSCS